MRGGVRYMVGEPLKTERFKNLPTVQAWPAMGSEILTRRGDAVSAARRLYLGIIFTNGVPDGAVDTLFPAWTATELRSKLVKLAETSGFIETEYSFGAPPGSRGSFNFRRSFFIAHIGEKC